LNCDDARIDKHFVLNLIEALINTNSRTIRNIIAITLRDIGPPDADAAAPALARLLTDPRTEGSRGTLIYALRAFDCSPYIELLVNLANTGGFEVKEESLKTLRKITSKALLSNTGLYGRDWESKDGIIFWCDCDCHGWGTTCSLTLHGNGGAPCCQYAK